jgi:parallel beta-helix repeat protein
MSIELGTAPLRARNGRTLTSVHSEPGARGADVLLRRFKMVLAMFALLTFSGIAAAWPSVTISSPTAGSTVSGVVTVTLSTSGATGAFLKVNNTTLRPVATSPFRFSWDTRAGPNGLVTLAAYATDSAGNGSVSRLVVSVSNGSGTGTPPPPTPTADTSPPSVSISAPSAGSTLRGTVAVSVTATDNVGIARVEARVNGTLIGTDTASPYTFSWDTTRVADGSATLAVSAYDAAGNAASASSTVSVRNATVSGVPTLTVNAVNAPGSVSVGIYPEDLAGLGTALATVTRSYNVNSRVWLTAPLRSGNNYFVKWQRDGVDFSRASTASVVLDASHTLTAVYEAPSCSGVAVYPGTNSIASAMSGRAGGTTYCIKAGVHRFTTAVSPRVGDKFIGEPGAVLNGAKVLTSFLREGSYWVATGQTQREALFNSANCMPASPACIYPEKVFRDGVELTQVTALSSLGAGRFFFDYTNYKIYLFDDPSGHTIEATTGSGGIVGFNGGPYDGVTVKNLVFEKFGGGVTGTSSHSALKSASGWIVENNVFRYASNMGVLNGKSIVRNNHIHHNGKYGIVGDGTFEGNVIEFNNTDGHTGTDAGGSKFLRTNGAIIRGNVFANNRERAVWADYDNINMTIEDNIVVDNIEVGIYYEVSCHGVIRNNVLSGNNTMKAGKSLWHGAAIYSRSSRDVQIYGNHVDAITGVHGIGVRGDDTGGAQTVYTAPNCGTIDSRNVSVRDNVVWLGAGDQHGRVGPGTGSTYNIWFTNNTYYLTDPTAGYFQYDGSIALKTKSTWQAAGQDTGGRFLQY